MFTEDLYHAQHFSVSHPNALSAAIIGQLEYSDSESVGKPAVNGTGTIEAIKLTSLVLYDAYM